MDEAYLKIQIDGIKQYLEQALKYATGEWDGSEDVTKNEMIRANVRWAKENMERVTVGLARAESQSREDESYIKTIK